MSGWIQGGEPTSPMKKYNHMHDPHSGEFGSGHGGPQGESAVKVHLATSHPSAPSGQPSVVHAQEHAPARGQTVEEARASSRQGSNTGKKTLIPPPAAGSGLVREEPNKAGTPGPEKARLSIRSSTYRGKPGFLISGKDTHGRSVSVFADSKEQADQAKTAMEAGKMPFTGGPDHPPLRANMTASGHRPIAGIAAEIRSDWGSKVNYAARPYLDAMGSLKDIKDNYGGDSAKSVVAYFLANSGSWKGDKARSVKAELRAILKK